MQRITNIKGEKFRFSIDITNWYEEASSLWVNGDVVEVPITDFDKRYLADNNTITIKWLDSTLTKKTIQLDNVSKMRFYSCRKADDKGLIVGIIAK